MPLQARQGNIKQWYFAHDSKHAQEQTKTVCDYSFYPSVRLMAKQVVNNSFQLNLPGLKGKIAYYQGVRLVLEFNEFKVADPRTVPIENTIVDTTFSGASVDIVATIRDFQFVIFFSQPDRVVPPSLFEPENPKCGILEISLHSLLNEFIRTRSQQKTYREILTDFLQNDITSKRWIYHPRFKPMANEAVDDLKRLGNILDPTVVPIKNSSNMALMQGYLLNQPTTTVNVTTNRILRFECVMCRSQWEGPEVGGNFCQKCHEHLYTRIIT
jgi:hypothetical protein